MLFDAEATPVLMRQQSFAQHYPKDGWVEHDPQEIRSSVVSVVKEVLEEADAAGYRVAGIGITNQRETTIIWDRITGKPIYNAVVWQDRRTAEACRRLEQEGALPEIRSRTGLLIDPYFSATKIAWLLTHVDGARALAEQGRLAFGTVDTFLIWHLTGGKVHAADATNACRTGLFNIHTGEWDDELLKLYDIPLAMLPEVHDCAANFGVTDKSLFGRALPILGVAGDQQAALIGQGCFSPGTVKSTYGTGCFVVMNTGDTALPSAARLLTTVAYRLGGKTTYALEGAIFIAGAAVQWLRDGLGVIETAQETEQKAAALPGNRGVYLVPAFTGLGAPHWNPNARGAIFGLTRDTGPAELARAALESVAYQTRDLLDAMEADGMRPQTLRVDGGMTANNWLMQFLSDILQVPVERPQNLETTALGAAYLAGFQAGVYGSPNEFSGTRSERRRFAPAMTDENRRVLLAGWDNALRRVLAP